MTAPGNFDFLAEQAPLLAELGATAERLFAFDPASCAVKLRLLAEAMTQDIAARLGIDLPHATQAELLRGVDARLNLDAQVRQLFDLLRRTGNAAAHSANAAVDHRSGMQALKVARELAVWFHRSFGGQPAFKPGPFVPPDDSSRTLLTLQQPIADRSRQVEDALAAQAVQAARADSARLREAEAEQQRALTRRAQEEAAVYEALAEEADARFAALQAQFDARLTAERSAAKAAAIPRMARRAAAAARWVSIDEAATRQIVDRQLFDAGWQADSERLTHAAGARPERGRNLAIAEWPVPGRQSADYVLFAGLVPLAAVEAKRSNVDVPGNITQAERYARGFVPPDGTQPAWLFAGRGEPWPDGQGGAFALPFVYSCNGRPFVKQLAGASGTWFRDARAPSHTARALAGFHSPAGLLDLLKRSRDDAEERLRGEGYGYLGLRDYQTRAITAVEASLADGRTACLVAMATGTGKTRTIIGLMYRLLKAERFRRILYLVDRTSLGLQAQGAFDDDRLEANQPLSRIYNVARLGDMAVEAETRVQVATVQAMARRLFGGGDDSASGDDGGSSSAPPPVDAYDCIVVDEAHRGYALDQEMTDGELALRDPAQYLSAYRRVLDHFDAVRIGMTATPALHTTEIFGKPVFIYSYREAVADGWLVDHEPPVRYETLLSRNGIRFDKGQQVQSLNLNTGEVETSLLDDDVDFQVEAFNRRVINEDFNRVICEQLAEELDPFGQEKTLIFCATDKHADTVKRLLDGAFSAKYGERYVEAAVRKITGAVDDAEGLIRRYKAEALPNIAITVDLLTTGIDVPAICHLVFMRRVRSRILYEQMKGRATRRCDEIGKVVFTIHDPVDLYAALQSVDTMQPLQKDPNVTLEQLLDELGDDASHAAPGAVAGRTHADDVLAQLNQKLLRVLRRAAHLAAKRPALAARLAELQQQWGVPPAELHLLLHRLGPKAASDFLRQGTRLAQQLADVQQLMGGAWMPLLSQHADALLAREQSWVAYQKPEDYLDAFGDFVREQINQSAALAAVVKCPNDLTRDGLRTVRLLLDGAGYSEANLKAAWRNSSNVDIAASIVGYIRQAAIGEALLPFEQRVAMAMQRVLAQRAWTPVQRKWLDRLAKQLAHEVVVDAALVNAAFAKDGGARQLDKVLGGELQEVLASVSANLWPRTG